MHGYYWGPVQLNKLLKSGFRGGQLRLKTKDGLIWRGAIEDWSFPDIKHRKICVSFKWLCEPSTIFNGDWTPQIKWSPIPTPQSNAAVPFEIEYRMYYPQPDEERIKMWGTMPGEIIRFFTPGDMTNLVLTEDGFVPQWFLPQFALRRAIFIGLARKQ